MRRVVTACPDESVLAAARRMRDEHVGDLVVVEGERPVGIVTDRDLVVRALAAELDPDSTALVDVMTHDLATVTADADVFEVLELMHRTGARRMPIVGDGGELVGILALDDILSWMADRMAVVGELVGQELRAERERTTIELAGQAAG